MKSKEEIIDRIDAITFWEEALKPLEVDKNFVIPSWAVDYMEKYASQQTESLRKEVERLKGNG